jgi:hypothetical protein
MLYGKATEVALTDVDTASSLTLMSADVERIVTGMETGHEVSHSLLIIVSFETVAHSILPLFRHSVREDSPQFPISYHKIIVVLPCIATASDPLEFVHDPDANGLAYDRSGPTRLKSASRCTFFNESWVWHAQYP